MTDRGYRRSSEVISRVTAQGLDAGVVYTVEAVRRQRTIAGTVTTVTVRVDQRLVEGETPHTFGDDERVAA